MSDTSSLPAGIGPHEGRELELLLAGTKPLARLHSEPTTGYIPEDLTEFEPHVLSGRLIRIDTTSADGLTINHYFCLPTEEWRIKILEVMNEVWKRPNHGGFSVDDYTRLEGTLFGYAKKDIETAVTHWNRAR